MTRIVLIGAGSAQFGLSTLGDIFQSEVLQGAHVVLHDINPTSLSKVAAVAQDHVERNQLPFTISATTDRREALAGARYCVSSIEIGDRFALWEQDWRVAQQYGIRQVYGENGGPGGLFHSLRIIPPILEICEDIQEICPQAYVFNYSNPMTRICQTVKRAYPDLRFVGLCHEIASLPAHLPKILDVPFDELFVRAGGLNHFSILLECRYRATGADAYPTVRERSGKYFERLHELVEASYAAYMRTGRRASPAEQKQIIDEWRERIKTTPATRTWGERGVFKVILENFGYLPITTDSHFGEYIAWAHSVAGHRGILDFYSWYRFYCATKESVIQDRTIERVVPIIDAIETDSGMEEMAVNIMNDGLITNLPRDLVVEVPATIDANGVHGVPLGELPKGIAALMRNQVGVLDLTAEAILQRSKALALQALLVDPVVDSVRAAKETLDTMLDLQKDYLGYLQ